MEKANRDVEIDAFDSKNMFVDIAAASSGWMLLQSF